MHGTEHCKQKLQAPRYSVPLKPFSPASGLTPCSAQQFLFCPGPVARIGLSLACNALRLSRSPFQGQRSQPDPSLPHQSLPRPVRLFGSATNSGSPRNRPLLRLEPVAASSTGSARRFLCLHSPSGCFASFRIKAFSRIRCLPARLPNPPDLRSLPAAVFYR